ncbi:MAG: ORF6N domain-containing protein [Bacteroidota bacterium]|nr:ORF6N domain-containing protein [Bacteroidota bacterium]
MTDLTSIIEKTIREKTYTIRGQKVMLDFDVADLYEVDFKTFRRAVSKNRKRFPPDYQFQLTEIEWAELQFRPTSFSIPVQKKTPTVFTEGGLLMLSGVLKSKKAVDASIAIINILCSLIKLR